MPKNKRIRILTIFVVFVLCIGLVGVLCYRFIRYEQAQNSQIAELRRQVAILNAKAGGSDEADAFKAEQGYHYLAIGNSITLHGIADYWWGEWGMAASERDSDFVHLITAFLEDKKENAIVSMPYNYSVWEVQSHDRAETWEFLDRYLFSKIDLITVQLSENCTDITTFQSDFAALLVHIREKCGSNVEIVVIDDFWSDEKSEMKKAVCDGLDVAFADLSDIRKQAEYQVGVGATVYGSDGAQHVIEHAGVARHPGDEAMRVIAERVIEKITKQ